MQKPNIRQSFEVVLHLEASNQSDIPHIESGLYCQPSLLLKTPPPPPYSPICPLSMDEFRGGEQDEGSH